MEPDNNEIRYGRYAIQLLVRRKILILTFVLLSTIISAVIAFMLPDEYTAIASAVPPKTSTSTLENMIGGISSTLKDIGLGKLGGKTEGVYSFLVILDSRAVKDSIINKYRFDTIYKIPMNQISKLREAFENNLEISLELEGNYTISFTDKDPIRAANVANDYILVANGIAQQLMQEEAKFNRSYLEQRLEGIEETLNRVVDSLQKFSQQKLIFAPLEQSKAISISYTDLKANKMAQEIIYNLYKTRFGENDPVTLSQKTIVDNINQKLYEFENKPGYVGNYPLKSSAKVGSDFLRLYAEFETYTKVKSFLLPVLEETKLNEYRKFQYLIFLDKATPPDTKSRPKRSIIIAGTCFGSFILISFLIVFVDSIRKSWNKIKLEP